MYLKAIKPLAVVSAVFFSAFASAETLYSVSAESLVGQTLFDQTLIETSLVTVKPSTANSATGDIQVLDQCLWSVNVGVEDGQLVYSAGKMICVGPNQEVLETIPVGEIEPFAQCKSNDCAEVFVGGNLSVQINLQAPLDFTLQPRNERK